MSTKILAWCAHILALAEAVSAKMEPFIVGGDNVKSIQEFPHSAALIIKCVSLYEHSIKPFTCGSSILNQAILLTAGHCYEDCSPATTTQVAVGTMDKREHTKKARSFLMHEDYVSEPVQNDIGLVLLETPLSFSDKVKRVVVPIDLTPLAKEPAMLAGWGRTGDGAKSTPNRLKYVRQKLYLRENCIKKLGPLMPGVLCGQSAYKETDPEYGYSDRGDSGSALLVRGYLQVGLVSFRRPSKVMAMAAYTDVPFYKDWIERGANKLYCKSQITSGNPGPSRG